MEFFEWLEHFWVIIAGLIGGITLVWNFCNKTLKEIKTELVKPFEEVNGKLDSLAADNKLIKEATLSSQRKDLLDSCEECLKNGFATLERQQTITEMYNTYHELGGDSFVTELVHRVCDLPLENPEYKKKKLLNENK